MQPHLRLDRLDCVMEALEGTIAAEAQGRERAWMADLGKELDQVEHVLRTQRDADCYGRGQLSSVASVPEARPTLDRQVRALIRQEEDLLELLGQFEAEVQSSQLALRRLDERSRVHEIETLRCLGRQLIELVRGHQGDITQLVLAAVNTDIGTGD